MTTPQQPAAYNAGVGYPVNEVKDGNLTLVDVYGTGQYGNLTARSINGLAAQGTPLNGPSPDQPTMFQQADGSIMVIPLSTYGLSGDDATWINNGLQQAGAGGRVRLINATYTVLSTIAVPGATPTAKGGRLSGSGRGTILAAGFGGASSNTGAVVSSHGSEVGASEFQGFGAIIENLVIDGTNVPGTTISTGLDYGDQYHGLIRDVVIQNFTATGTTTNLQSNPLGAVGLNINNQAHLTEKLHVTRTVINNCTNLFQTVTTTGGSTSHMYSDIDLTLNAQPQQNGWVIGRQGHLENGILKLRGNFNNNASAANCAAIVLGVGTQQGHSFNMDVDINLETDPSGSGSTQPVTIKFGTNADNTIASWRGRVRFAGGWQSATGIQIGGSSASSWQFSGRLVGDTALFAALVPYVTPVNGTTYTNNGPDAWVTVTGGTVTSIVVNGVTTNLTTGSFLLPMNQTIQFNFSSVPTTTWISALAA